MHENSLAPMTLSRPAGRDAIEGAYSSLQSADHLVGGVGWSVGPAVLSSGRLDASHRVQGDQFLIVKAFRQTVL